jgi:hypothetical protein
MRRDKKAGGVKTYQLSQKVKNQLLAELSDWINELENRLLAIKPKSRLYRMVLDEISYNKEKYEAVKGDKGLTFAQLLSLNIDNPQTKKWVEEWIAEGKTK